MTVPLQRSPKPAHRAPARTRLPDTGVLRVGTAALVLLLLVAMMTAIAVWAGVLVLLSATTGVAVSRRSIEAKAWERELENAFGLHGRQALTLGRIL